MRPLSQKATYALLGLAAIIIVATWLTLVIWQPSDSNYESLADSKSSTIDLVLSLIHISEPTRLHKVSRMPSSA